MINTLNILPCHSIWKPSISNNNKLFGLDREEWVLVSFQIEGNDHLAMVEHIIKCLMVTTKNTMTVFSGGYTKKEFPDISESKSYYELAMRYYSALADRTALIDLQQQIKNTKFLSLISTFEDYFNMTQDQIFIENIAIEEYAMDSFDNLYFSLALFKHMYNTEVLCKVVITGFGFKERRFSDLHWKYSGAEKKLVGCTLNFNSNSPIHYYNDMHGEYIESVNKSEKAFGYDLFVKDPFAIRGKLAEKKGSRNFKGMTPKNSVYGDYLIDFDPSLSDHDLLTKVEESELYM